MPADHGAADGVERGALAAGCCCTFAPKIVIEGVYAGLDGVPIWTICQLLLLPDSAILSGPCCVPPHMGSPTARRSTAGVGFAVASKPRDAAKIVVVNFIVNEIAMDADYVLFREVSTFESITENSRRHLLDAS